MQFSKRRELKRTKIEIIPMIDTMFFLLVFFMLSSLALVKLNGLPVNLPKAASAPRQSASELTVTIDSAKHLFIGQERVDLETLGKKLREKAGGSKMYPDKAVIVVNADESVPHGLVVACIDAAREVGITRFALATKPKP